MYIAPSDYSKASAIVKLNFELGAFLNIHPLFAEESPSASDDLDAFKHIYFLQKMLKKRNYSYPSQNPLHLLASHHSLSTPDVDLLQYLLSSSL